MVIPYSAQLIPRSRRSSTSPHLVTIYQHQSREAGQASVYAIIETSSSPQQAESLIEIITHNLEQLGEKPQDDRAFEAVVKQMNTELHDYSLSGNSTALSRTHAVIACIINDIVSVVRTGKAEAYLYRGRHAVQITDDLDPLSPSKLTRTFSEAASGDLKPGDRLLLATPGLYHQLGLSRIAEIMQDNTPPTALQKIAGFIDKQPDAERVGAIAIEVLASAVDQSIPDIDTTVIEISSNETMLEGAKAEAAPVVHSVTKGATRAAQGALSWTQKTLLPASRRAVSKTTLAVKNGYNRLKKR